MKSTDKKKEQEEKEELRSVALRNARSIHAARQKAEAELIEARDAMSRRSDWLRVTLESIADAVVATDADGNVLLMNSVAQTLTGWPESDALGIPLSEVFRVIHEENGLPLDNPAELAIREQRVVGLADHALLVSRDGSLTPVDDSAAPILDDDGTLLGSVLVFRDVGERRRAMVELQRSERELAEFFENASIGIHWVGPEGTILRANRTELEMLGYSREEYVGKDIRDFHKDRWVIDDVLRRLHEGEDVIEHESIMCCRDGTLRNVSINSSVYRENGRFIHTRCFTTDITERKASEVMRAHLAAIVENSHDAIISKDPNGSINSWNEAAVRLYGYTAQEMIGKPITTLIPDELLGEEVQIMERLRRGERVEELQTIRVTKDGRRLDVSITVSPILDSNGKMVGASKIARDVTERTLAERALRRSEQTTRFLADASATLSELSNPEASLRRVAALAVPSFADWCAVFLTQPDGTPNLIAIEHADPARLDAARDMHLRHPLRSGYPGMLRSLKTGRSEWIPSVESALHAAVSPDEEQQLRTVRALGIKSYICCPITSRNGTVGALTFATAESDRVYTSSELAVAEDLAHRIGIAMDNASLLAALKDADRRKDEFLAMLAHELRNPLAPVRNAVQIMHISPSQVPEVEWAREVIERQVQQMNRLVDDLLDVSRITRGKIELRKEKTDLALVVGRAVEATRPIIDKMEHTLTVTIPPEPIHLEADLTRLTQVLMNLLNNAAKYTPRGGRIWLTVHREGADAVIRVRDTGVGIPQEMLPRIFDMFTQVDRTLERSEGGLGIGLTLVKLLVEMHNGTVRAYSAGPGAGAEFVVRLQLLAREEPKDPAPATAKPEDRTSLPPSRILVVDDNRDAADTMGILLKMLGSEVHIAGDGLEAVDAASTFRPDVILMDIGLPKLNGYDAARRIRSEHGDSIVLVAVTGWGQEEDQRRSRDAGFDHHLVKPIALDALRRVLLEAQEKRRGR